MDRRTTKQRKRSNKLREVVITKFKRAHNGHVFCQACGFNFEKAYGVWGKDFIEIHHKEPIYSLDISGSFTTLEDSLEKTALLCSNCHRMIHRKKFKMLSIDELSEILKNNKAKRDDRIKKTRKQRTVMDYFKYK